MLKNYLKIALRHLSRHKGYAFINVFGLAVGIACCLLLALFVRDELTYDAFHAHSDDVFRVTSALRGEESWNTMGITPMPMGPVLEAEFPEVLHSVRVWKTEEVIRRGDRSFSEELTFTDPAFFDVFSFPLRAGHGPSALEDPNSIVLSRAVAEKYFGDEEALEQTIAVKLKHDFHLFTVTGVADALPPNSSVTFDVLVPYGRIADQRSARLLDNWGSLRTSTFVRLREDASPADVEAKFPAFTRKYLEDRAETYRFGLQPLPALHLGTEVEAGLEPVSDPRYSYILGGIALLVLLIACINFTNLSIARASTRSREIGVRKVLGAARGQVMKQFWGEALLLTFLALLLGLALAELSLPTFNDLSGKELSLVRALDVTTVGVLLGGAVLLGLLTGLYPALLMSGFRPVAILKNRLRLGDARWLTRGLIVFQFAIAAFLIVGLFVTSGQLRFLLSQDLGFGGEQVVVLPTHSDEGRPLFERFATRLGPHEAVLSLSSTSESLGRKNTYSMTFADAEGSDEGLGVYAFKVDPAFLATLDIQLIEGRNFTDDRPADATTGVLVNEALVRELGWDDPLGKRLSPRLGELREATVIGVVQDFHFQSLHDEVAPALLHMAPDWPTTFILARLRPGEVSRTLGVLQRAWHDVAPGLPFDYYFLDEDFNRQYRAEQRWSWIVGYASIFAVLLACLGLFGLAAVVVERRTKEIGIRKVFGASVGSVVGLLSSQFVRLVLAAVVVACPLAYLAARTWLATFAYHIDLGAGIFLGAGALVIGIALLTVSFHALRAALLNPAESLRYE